MVTAKQQLQLITGLRCLAGPKQHQLSLEQVNKLVRSSLTTAAAVCYGSANQTQQPKHQQLHTTSHHHRQQRRIFGHPAAVIRPSPQSPAHARWFSTSASSSSSSSSAPPPTTTTTMPTDMDDRISLFQNFYSDRDNKRASYDEFIDKDEAEEEEENIIAALLTTPSMIEALAVNAKINNNYNNNNNDKGRRKNYSNNPGFKSHLDTSYCAFSQFQDESNYRFLKDKRFGFYTLDQPFFMTTLSPFRYWRHYYWISMMLGNRKIESWRDAMAVLNVHIDNGIATTHTFDLFLLNSRTAKVARELISKEMPKCHAEPSEFSYCALATKHMIEGDFDAARNVLTVEMPAQGIKPTSRTARTRNLPVANLSKHRLNTLMAFMRGNGPDSYYEGKQYFRTLVERGVSDVYSYNLMVRNAWSADVAYDLVFKSMPKAGVVPNETVYKTMLEKLLLEADYLRARQVYTKLVADGVHIKSMNWLAESATPPNDKEQNLDSYRAAELKRLFGRGALQSHDASWKLFNTLADRKKIGLHHCTVMLQACLSFTEAVKLVAGPMTDANIRPHISTYTMLIRKLLIEGDRAGVNNILNTVLPAANLTQDREMREIVNLSETKLGHLRTLRIQYLLTHGSEKAVEQARILYLKLDEKKLFTKANKRNIMKTKVKQTHDDCGFPYLD